jgi:hypothetical protein
LAWRVAAGGLASGGLGVGDFGGGAEDGVGEEGLAVEFDAVAETGGVGDPLRDRRGSFIGGVMRSPA